MRRATASAGSSSIASSSVCAAALELAERAQRRGERHADVDLPRVVGGGQQSQRRLEPARPPRPARAAPSPRPPRAAARSRPRRPARPTARRGARARPARRPAAASTAAARACAAEPPAAGRRLVDRAAHERVAEDEAPRHAASGARGRVASSASSAVSAVGVRQLGDRRREVGLERLAGDRRRLEQRPRRRPSSDASSSASDAATARRNDARVDLAPRRCRRGRRPRARELLEVERVAAAVAVDRRDRRRGRGRRAARPPRASLSCSSSKRRHRRHRERGRQPRRRLPRAEREREQDRGVRPAPQQRAEQLDRRPVAPVQVVEHEHERPVRGEQLEQRADRAVHAVALVGEAVARRPLRRRRARQDAAELARQLGAPRRVGAQLLRGDVGVERVDPDAERQVALELGRRAAEHEVPALLGAFAQLAEQARLADPGLALDRDAGPFSPRQRVQGHLDLVELAMAPHQRAGAAVRGHEGHEHTPDRTALQGPVQGRPPMIERRLRKRVTATHTT